jgi:hypothetical protein
MLRADDALIYEFIHAAHDPDPRRAVRFRPFAPALAPARVADAPMRWTARGDAKPITAFVGRLAEPFRRLLPVHRAVPAPCC